MFLADCLQAKVVSAETEKDCKEKNVQLLTLYGWMGSCVLVRLIATVNDHKIYGFIQMVCNSVHV